MANDSEIKLGQDGENPYDAPLLLICSHVNQDTARSSRARSSSDKPNRPGLLAVSRPEVGIKSGVGCSFPTQQAGVSNKARRHFLLSRRDLGLGRWGVDGWI